MSAKKLDGPDLDMNAKEILLDLYARIEGQQYKAFKDLQAIQENLAKLDKKVQNGWSAWKTFNRHKQIGDMRRNSCSAEVIALAERATAEATTWSEAHMVFDSLRHQHAVLTSILDTGRHVYPDVLLLAFLHIADTHNVRNKRQMQNLRSACWYLLIMLDASAPAHMRGRFKTSRNTGEAQRREDRVVFQEAFQAFWADDEFAMPAFFKAVVGESILANALKSLCLHPGRIPCMVAFDQLAHEIVEDRDEDDYKLKFSASKWLVC